MKRRRYDSRFDGDSADPMAAMGSLGDLMLVFVCGLIAALSLGGAEIGPADGGAEPIEKLRELPELPAGVANGGGGYEAVGQVYRDPRTGTLILVGDGSR